MAHHHHVLPASICNAPLTVRDAMSVVRELGMRYLWVDRYCIDQQDAQEQKASIHNMDHIYSNAVATIVALFGADDRAGLPGMSVRARSPQPFYRSPDNFLLSTLPPLRSVIQDSTWATRAWTYQEARLSRRCIFFTEFQSYYVCRQLTRSESIRIPDPESDIAACMIVQGINDIRDCSNIPHILNRCHLGTHLFQSVSDEWRAGKGLFRDIYNYSRRSLTYESDVLHTFRGILKRSGWMSFWGVPVIRTWSVFDAHLGFALGLMWTRNAHPTRFDRPCARRAEFPTWSWLSLTSTIVGECGMSNDLTYEWRHPGTRPVERDNVQSSIQFWITSTTGSEIPLPLALNEAPSNVIPEISPQITVEGEVVQLGTSRERCIYCFCDGHGRPIPDLPNMFVEDLDFPVPNASWTNTFGIPSIWLNGFILLEWTDVLCGASEVTIIMMALGCLDDHTAVRQGSSTTFITDAGKRTLPACRDGGNASAWCDGDWRQWPWLQDRKGVDAVCLWMRKRWLWYS